MRKPAEGYGTKGHKRKFKFDDNKVDTKGVTDLRGKNPPFTSSDLWKSHDKKQLIDAIHRRMRKR